MGEGNIMSFTKVGYVCAVSSLYTPLAFAADVVVALAKTAIVFALAFW